MTLIEPGTTAHITAGDPSAKALRAQIAWQEDRFELKIFLMQAGAETLVCRSSSEALATDWPRHPPLQQMSLEEINGRPTLLGIGLAGTSHWSVSIETTDGPEPSILLDYACKHRGDIEFLGSRYDIADGVEAKTDAFAGILLKVADNHLQIAPADDSSLATLSVQQQHWQVCPEEHANPARWKYEICLM